MTTYWCEHAVLGDGVQPAVRIDVRDGRIVSLSAEASAEGAERLSGLTIPGFANCHSHVFHRALRGRTQRERGTFWTWRQQMYALAGRLDPDSYFELATAVYREMVAVGMTAVGEFHYLHHAPDGTRYADPNAMGLALAAAASEAGIRLTLLDTCYLASGIGTPPEGVQRRFDDGSAGAWRDRVEALADAAPPGVIVGAAIHSVRAVPRDQIGVVADWATQAAAPLHVHLSEQPAENEACLAAYGRTPTELLDEAGALSDRTSAVHATHLTGHDIERLGATATYACFCPTTERDLGDGIGPARPLAAAGSSLTLGSDSHAVIDPFEEMRALELDERLASRERGHWTAAELVAIGTRAGHRSLGRTDVGRIEVGAAADLVTIDLTSLRTAGGEPGPETAVFAAGGADVTHVLVDGVARPPAAESGDLARRLDAVVQRLWRSA